MNNKAIATLGLAILGAVSSSAASAQDAGTPYQFHRNVYFQTYAASALIPFNADAAVPAGKRLIVEHVSIRSSLPAGQSAMCSLQQNGGPRLYMHKLVQMQPSVAGITNVESYASFMTKAYVDAGDFRVSCDRIFASGTGWVNVVLTGTLVDAQ